MSVARRGRAIVATAITLVSVAACADLIGLGDKSASPPIDAAIETGSPLDAAIADTAPAVDANVPDGAPRVTVDTISTGEDKPWGIVVDGADIFWQDEGSAPLSGTIKRKNKGPGSPVVVVASGISHGRILVHDASFVYFAAENSPPALDGGPNAGDDGGAPTLIGRVPKEAPPDAGTAMLTVIQSGNDESLVKGLALFDDVPLEGGIATDPYLFVGEDTTIERDTRDGLSGGAVVGALANLIALAVDDQFVYFATRTDRAISRIPKDGSLPASVLASDDVSAIAIDAQAVYWVNPDGTVKRIAKDGSGQPTTIAVAGSAETAAIAVDGTAVYWLRGNPDAQSGGELLSAPKTATNASPFSIMSGLADPHGLALDHDPMTGHPRLYVTSRGDGTIHRASLE